MPSKFVRDINGRLPAALMAPASLSKSPEMLRLPIVSPFCFALLCVAAPSAAAQENAAICKDEASPADAAIAACSKIIQVSKAKTNDLASTYYNRAIAYRQKNDLDNALSDYSDAIKINPKHARAFNNRGTIYKEKGDLDRAIADFSEAIRLDAKFTAAYFNRGNAYDDKGDAEKALG